MRTRGGAAKLSCHDAIAAGRFASSDFAAAAAAAAAGRWVCVGWGRRGRGDGRMGLEPGPGAGGREVRGRSPAAVGFCRPGRAPDQRDMVASPSPSFLSPPNPFLMEELAIWSSKK